MENQENIALDYVNYVYVETANLLMMFRRGEVKCSRDRMHQLLTDHLVQLDFLRWVLSQYDFFRDVPTIDEYERDALDSASQSEDLPF